jgi:hypothetical protein
MTAYRIYFLAGNGRISAHEDFEADTDVSAIRIARALCDACSDVCAGFELWQGQRRIPARQLPHNRASIAELSDAHQRVVIETEESICRSRWAIAQSQRLMDLLASIKASGSEGAQSA